MEEAEEIFEDLNRSVGNVLSYRSFISSKSPENNNDTETIEKYEKGFKILKAQGLIYRSGNFIQVTDTFYKASSKGGLNNWISYKEEKTREEQRKIKQNEELIESTIASNKISKNTNIIAAIVSTVTLIVLFFQVINDNKNATKSDQQELQLQSLKQQNIKQDSLINHLLHLKEIKIDSLTSEFKK